MRYKVRTAEKKIRAFAKLDTGPSLKNIHVYNTPYKNTPQRKNYLTNVTWCINPF